MQLTGSIQPKLKIEELTLSSDGFRIQARNGGIVASILSAMGVGSKSHMEIDPRGATLRIATFSGETRTYIPLNHASATVYRYGSPTGWLVAAGFLGFAGLGGLAEGAMMQGLIIWALAALFIALYLFGPKAVTIGIVSDAGTADSLRLEAKGDELTKLRQAAEWLERAVAKAGSTPSAAPTAEPPVQIASAGSSNIMPTRHTVRGQ